MQHSLGMGVASQFSLPISIRNLPKQCIYKMLVATEFPKLASKIEQRLPRVNLIIAATMFTARSESAWPCVRRRQMLLGQINCKCRARAVSAVPEHIRLDKSQKKPAL